MNGFQRALLLQLAMIFQNAAPAKKITAPGYLKMLLSNGTPNIISQSVTSGDSGHVRDVKFWYNVRSKSGQSSTTDTCDIDSMPVRLESSIPSTLFRSISLFFDETTISKYEKEASTLTAVQGNGIGDAAFKGIMKEVYEQIIMQMNGLVTDINGDLLALQAAAFGVNAPYATNAIQTINFNKNANINDLTTGMTRVESDAMENEFDINNAAIVGGGLLNQYMIQQNRHAIGASLTGLDTSKLALPNYFYDPRAGAAWGNANAFGVFDKDSVLFLDVNRYVGAFAGPKPNSWFGNIYLPIQDSLGDSLQSMRFDIQIKYLDCPQSINVGGVATNVGRGWQVILSKSFNQVNLPTDAYQDGDPLDGNNGTLLYQATNTAV